MFSPKKCDFLPIENQDTTYLIEILAEPVKMHLIIVKYVEKNIDSVLKNNVKNSLKKLCSLKNSYHDKTQLQSVLIRMYA